MVLPGGRFSCAQSLVDRQLGFLRGRSLGQVCHIVQLAISQKKMLGYSTAGITPYAHSQSMLKDKAAAQQNACASGATTGDLPLATWDTARAHLRVVLKASLEAGASSVPLSNIKRVFRAQFQTELSETALGHSKLSELLQDERLGDTCTVKLLDQGYFVIPLFTLEESKTAQRVVFCPDEPLCLEDAAPVQVAESNSVDRWFPYSPFALGDDGHAGSMIRNTFIHTQSLGGSAHKRRKSLPRDFGSRKCRFETSCHSLGFQSEPLKEVLPSPAVTASPTWTPRHINSHPLLSSPLVGKWSDYVEEEFSCDDSSNRLKFCVDNPLCFEEVHDSCSHSLPITTPSPAWTPRPDSMPLISLSRTVVRLSDFV